MSLLIKGILLCLIATILILIVYIACKHRGSFPAASPQASPRVTLNDGTPVAIQDKHIVTKTIQKPKLV
jgi:hypothetical protein